MKTPHFTRLAIIVVFVLLAIAPIVPVHAGDGVSTETIPFNEDVVIRRGQLCPFTVESHYEGVLSIKVWVDENGNTMRELDNYRQQWTYSANGITLKANNGGPSHITFLSDTEMMLRYTGAYTLVTSHGPLLGSAGQGWERYELTKKGWVKVDEGFKAGNFAWDPEAFCAAFE